MDIIASGDFGRDDGIKCHICGGDTYLVFDDGYGLCYYDCYDCNETTGVQYEVEWDDYYDEDDWLW